MKTLSVAAVKGAVEKAITPKSADKIAVASQPKLVKNGEKLLANGQDASAVQGKAMIKKSYVKPEMQEVKLKKENTKASSGEGWDKGGEDDYGNGTDLDSDFGSNNIWGNN